MPNAADDKSKGGVDAARSVAPLRELQLVEAHRRGDPDAIGELLRLYQRRIYTICYRMVRNDHDARDRDLGR